ncbi:hypothetical protein BDY21DRAFT_340086 [Lineolata rhizophorae]|uniref:Uncharacterized protein n=1 Tax=Lineolata rhizophorae TaxID=578093 RepID=A0A6A6P5L6_9PEZI|nr:hypothetical protein BDY21DRAFT_340086 [Lineolata rhizophorae]
MRGAPLASGLRKGRRWRLGFVGREVSVGWVASCPLDAWCWSTAGAGQAEVAK